MKAFCFESIGDESSAVYIESKAGLFKLHCVVDPKSALDAGHTWPTTATSEEVARWKGSCRYRRVAVGDDLEAGSASKPAEHDYRTCKAFDCEECQELVDHDIVMACDECDSPGDKKSDGWVLCDDGRTLCQSCAGKEHIEACGKKGPMCCGCVSLGSSDCPREVAADEG